MADKLQALILAGGEGKRLRSKKTPDLPKPLREVGGVPMLVRVLSNLRPVLPRPVILVGYKGAEVVAATRRFYRYAWQEKQLGTGHAVLSAKDELIKSGAEDILILSADHPFLSSMTIFRLIRFHKRNRNVVSLASIRLPDFDGDNGIFYGFGRIIRNQDGSIGRISELKDASETERNITEVNISLYCFNSTWLWEHIDKLDSQNNAGEYYLTDLVRLAVSGGYRMGAMVVENYIEGIGINTPSDLEIAERYAKLLSRGEVNFARVK